MYILVSGILIKILLLAFWLLLVIINNKSSIKYFMYFILKEYELLCFLEYIYVFKLVKILNIFLSQRIRNFLYFFPLYLSVCPLCPPARTLCPPYAKQPAAQLHVFYMNFKWYVK